MHLLAARRKWQQHCQLVELQQENWILNKGVAVPKMEGVQM
jgi:hypothetical protein